MEMILGNALLFHLEHVDGKTSRRHLAIPVVPNARSPSIRETVINGPPERSRTRLPLRNAGAAWFCIAAVDGAEAEKAGARGILSASVTAIAIEACFVGANILNSILKLCGLQALVATGMQ